MKEQRATVEAEVVARMRFYLGRNPETVFSTAIDLTKMVAGASKPKTLDLWLKQMRDMTPDYTPTKPALPKTTPRRKSPTQKRR